MAWRSEYCSFSALPEQSPRGEASDPLLVQGLFFREKKKLARLGLEVHKAKIRIMRRTQTKEDQGVCVQGGARGAGAEQGSCLLLRLSPHGGHLVGHREGALWRAGWQEVDPHAGCP